MKRVAGWPYSVTRDGEVFSHKKNAFIKGGFAGRAPRLYRAVVMTRNNGGNVERKSIRHHQLVLAAYVGPCPSGKQINHKNGNRLDNRIENLEYCTAKENTRHAVASGLTKTGADCPWAKLTEEKAVQIVELRAQRKGYKEIARITGVSGGTVGGVISGRHWKQSKKVQAARTKLEGMKPFHSRVRSARYNRLPEALTLGQRSIEK